MLNSPDVSRLRDEDGRNILHHCVANRRSQACFAYLLRRYPQLLLAADYQGLSVMHLAVINGNLPLLRFLCGEGRKCMAAGNFRLLLNAPDNELHSCLHWAVVCLEEACLQVLLQAAAEERTNASPAAATATTTAGVHQQQSIQPNLSNNPPVGLAVRDIHGATPLHYAAQAASRRMRSLSAARKNGHTENINSSDFNQDYNLGSDSEETRIDDGRPDSQTDKLEKGKTERRSDDKDSMSKVALRILKRILQSGQVNVDCRDNEGRTPLLWAASSGENDALMQLLNAGANINAQDKEGLTGNFF
jgi:ankyrin repeat protein